VRSEEAAMVRNDTMDHLGRKEIASLVKDTLGGLRRYGHTQYSAVAGVVLALYSGAGAAVISSVRYGGSGSGSDSRNDIGLTSWTPAGGEAMYERMASK
jgi:hypothetical protein